jgi:hypothetical protein
MLYSKCSIGTSMKLKWVIIVGCLCINIILIRLVIHWLICLIQLLMNILSCWIYRYYGTAITIHFILVMLFLTFGGGWKMIGKSWIVIFKALILLLTIFICRKIKPGMLYCLVVLILVNKFLTRLILCVVGILVPWRLILVRRITCIFTNRLWGMKELRSRLISCFIVIGVKINLPLWL